MVIERYEKVGVGAWAARALYDETITAILTNSLDNLKVFIDLFPEICQYYGGKQASQKIAKASQILRHNNYPYLANSCMKLSKQIEHYPLAPSCLNLFSVSQIYQPNQIISLSIEKICQFLKCLPIQLEDTIEYHHHLDKIPDDWYDQVSLIYSRGYQEWFIPFATQYLDKYLPRRQNKVTPPLLRVIDWSKEVWRCWRLLKNRPTLIDPGIFKPAQFFVWHIIHDSVHIWQMQAYSSTWSNILTPQDFLFLEAQAMCVERTALNLMLSDQLTIPEWYPSTNKAVILRLLIGILEREIRLYLDLSLHLDGQNIDNCIKKIGKLTGISSSYFLGFSYELLGMPGFSSAYTVVTDYFLSLTNEQRKILLNTSIDKISKSELCPLIT